MFLIFNLHTTFLLYIIIHKIIKLTEIVHKKQGTSLHAATSCLSPTIMIYLHEYKVWHPHKNEKYSLLVLGHSGYSWLLFRDKS